MRKLTDHPAKTAIYRIVAGSQYFIRFLEASRFSMRTYRSRLHSIPCHQHRRRLYRLRDLAERKLAVPAVLHTAAVRTVDPEEVRSSRLVVVLIKKNR